MVASSWLSKFCHDDVQHSFADLNLRLGWKVGQRSQLLLQLLVLVLVLGNEFTGFLFCFSLLIALEVVLIVIVVETFGDVRADLLLRKYVRLGIGIVSSCLWGRHWLILQWWLLGNGSFLLAFLLLRLDRILDWFVQIISLFVFELLFFLGFLWPDNDNVVR